MFRLTRWASQLPRQSRAKLIRGRCGTVARCGSQCTQHLSICSFAISGNDLWPVHPGVCDQCVPAALVHAQYLSHIAAFFTASQKWTAARHRGSSKSVDDHVALSRINAQRSASELTASVYPTPSEMRTAAENSMLNVADGLS